MSPRKNADIWDAHMRKYEASGLTATGYCNKHKLALATFYYWRRRLSTAVKQGKIEFKEIQLSEDILMPVISIHFANGTTLRLEGSMPASYVRELAGC